MSVRRVIVRVVLIAIAAGGFSITLAAAPADQPGVGAFRWVRGLTESDRAVYLQDAVLRSLPKEYRHALVGSIPKGAARAAFWRAAFSSYRDHHDMAPGQVAALNRAISHSTAEALAGTVPAVKAWADLENGLSDALGEAGADAVLYKSTAIGPNGVGLPIRERIAYGWRHLKGRVATAVRWGSNVEVKCNCNTNPHCNDPGLYCAEFDCDSTGTTQCGGAGSSCFKYCLPIPEQLRQPAGD